MKYLEIEIHKGIRKIREKERRVRFFPFIQNVFPFSICFCLFRQRFAINKAYHLYNIPFKLFSANARTCSRAFQSLGIKLERSSDGYVLTIYGGHI